MSNRDHNNKTSINSVLNKYFSFAKTKIRLFKMGVGQELRTILWKNAIIRLRHWFLTIIEIIVPIVLFFFLTYGRSKVPELSKVHQPAQYYEPMLEHNFMVLPIENLDIWYAPYSNITHQIIDNVQERYQVPSDAIKSFNSEEELFKQNPEKRTKHIIAIIFKGNAKHLAYDMRIFGEGLIWETNNLYPTELTGMEKSHESYFYIQGSFTAMQLAIDLAFIKLNKPTTNLDDFKFTLQEFPDPPMDSDVGISQILMNFMPLLTMLSFLFLSSSVIKRVVEEKHSGIKEYMKMVGMKQWMMRVGWILYAISCNIISIIGIVILMKVPLFDVPFPLIEFSSGTLMFVFLLLYCLAAVACCFLIASLWNNPSIAMLFGILFWIFSYFIPCYVLSKSDQSTWCTKILFALFPNMGLYFGYNTLYLYETRGVGLQWSNFYTPGSGSSDDLTMLNVLVVFAIEIFVFTILAVYVDNINPGSYGIAKPVHYPLLQLLELFRKPYGVDTSPNSDPENGALRREVSISIRNLNKQYDCVRAVKDLNWPIYKNRITVLLGQNGAGKTTTMSMLTGMINATSGSIRVNNLDLKKHLSKVQKIMGLCPQENLLFPDLTVVEHLIFFAMLKGKSYPAAKRDAIKELDDVGLGEKMNEMTHTLSGGMKRKLCLCMALMGDPQILILDEPTSGMDPETREKISNHLIEIRKSKTILISTHNMDDAEMLGDRIAIMAQGELICDGTPLELKNKYKTGYHLAVTINPKDYSNVDTRKELEECIKVVDFEHINLTANDDNTQNTYYYLIKAKDKICYQDLLKKIENVFESAKISLTITTLDDVLECVQKSLDKVDSNDDKTKQNVQATSEIKPTPKNQLVALLYKRFYFFKQKPLLYIPALATFFVCMLCAMSLANGNKASLGYTGPTFALTLKSYGPSNVYFYSDSNVDDIAKNYMKVVQSEDSKAIWINNVQEAIVKEGTENIAYYKRHLIAGAEFNKTEDNTMLVNILYSSYALHSLPISTNLALNALAKHLLGEEYEISTSVTPLKLVIHDSPNGELSDAKIGLLWLFVIPIGALMGMSCFIVFPFYEITSNFIQIQTMTGLRPAFYWAVNLLVDSVLAIVSILLVGLSVFLFEARSASAYWSLMAILIIFAVSFLPLVYLLSWSKTVTAGIARVVTLGLLISIVSTVVVIVMEESGMETYVYWGHFLKYLFLVTMPPFMLSYNVCKIAQTAVANYNWMVMVPAKKQILCTTTAKLNSCCSGTCGQYQQYWNEENGISMTVLLSFVTILLFFIFVERMSIWKIMLKLILTRKDLSNIRKDSKYNMEVKNLVKGKRLLDVSFEVNPNECFGLLGCNGAGKTTTFNILTKNENKNQGSIQIKTKDNILSSEDDEYLSHLGYCPQIDSLNPALTPSQLVKTMALLRGTRINEKRTDEYLNLFGLKKYANQPSVTLSGGNKRKLSTCLAFISLPGIILLDEPTSGVDPMSRQSFWKVLQGFKRTISKTGKKISFILCSHSMDECEALCDKIGIMKKGKIEAIGTLAHLKSEYGTGYKIQIQVKNDPDEDQIDGDDNMVEIVRNKFCEKFNAKDCKLYSKHNDQIHFQVKNVAKLSTIFEKMEQLKTETYVGDYTVTDCSLKDVLIKIANDTAGKTKTD